MSTNHNRIKVSDLETNEPDKILKTNKYGELEFSEASANADSLFETGPGLNSIQSKNNGNTASGIFSIATGNNTQANGNFSSAENFGTIANGTFSHAKGYGTLADNDFAYAEGDHTSAKGNTSHAEGKETIAIADYSHAQGYKCQSAGYFSHAGGNNTKANGESSFVHGTNSIANGANSVVFGNSSKSDANNVVVLGRDIYGNQADTTYVSKLNIKYLNSGTTTVGLGLDSNGNVIGNPPQNLQSVLDTGSGANTNNEMTIVSPHFRFLSSKSKGAIITDGRGMTIQGQEGGLYLEGNSGGLHLGNTTVIDFSAPAEFLSETRFKSPTRVKNGNNLIFEGLGNNAVINKGQYNGDPLLINCDDGILVNYKNIATAVNGVTADRSGMIVTMAVNNTTTPLTLSDLNSTYPNVLPAYRVQCFNIDSGGIIYEKSNISSNGIPQWFKYNATRVL